MVPAGHEEQTVGAGPDWPAVGEAMDHVIHEAPLGVDGCVVHAGHGEKEQAVGLVLTY